jgi:3',5'-cyclic AMP phosphodiesterase CpdA
MRSGCRPAVQAIFAIVATVLLYRSPVFPSAASAVAIEQQAKAPAAAATPLPNREGSLKFAVLGDFGTGDRPQREVAAQMAKLRSTFPFELVITVGDNIYGDDGPADMKRKFEDPYKALLTGGVKFFASLGNHDDLAVQTRYAPFNMDGEQYYSFKAPKQDVRFFALKSDYLEKPQLDWLEKELDSSREDWKIPYFHHPLYSSGERHGSHQENRAVLEPLFVKYNASVVFAGHDHF